jgi:hypothetical protein
MSVLRKLSSVAVWLARLRARALSGEESIVIAHRSQRLCGYPQVQPMNCMGMGLNLM